MIFKNKIILVFIILCGINSYAQINSNNSDKDIIRQKIEKERLVNEQAVLLLKNSLLNLKSIENLRQKTDVLTEASTTLWDYDRSFAEESLLNFITQSLADHKDLLSKESITAEENITLRDLTYALKKSLKTLAGKDLEKATLLQNNFFENQKQGLKGKKLNDSLELAAEGLDSDQERTIGLLTEILKQGVPGQFPKFIFELREKKPVVAKILMQKAMQNLAANPNYKAIDALNLSIIIFNEKVVLIPSLNDETNLNDFYVFTSRVETSVKPTEKELVSDYFFSVQNFFRLRLRNQANGFFVSPKNLIRSYFLLKKLKSYNQIYRLNNSATLNDISIPIENLMQTAGFSLQTLSDINGYANRLANSNNPLGLDNGTGLFEKAEDAKTQEEKLEYLISGIIQLIEFKEFAKAERKVFDIGYSEIRDSLYELIYVRAGFESIKNKNWNEFEKNTEKIVDKRIKAFLYLKAISDNKQPNKNDDTQFSEYIIRAETNIQEILDKNAKASALVHLTDVLLTLNYTEGILMLPNAIKSINESPDFNEDEFEINIKIPTRQTYFAEFIGANSFRNIFSKIAKNDWDDLQIQSLQIKPKGLQLLAQVIAAKHVLRKNSLPK